MPSVCRLVVFAVALTAACPGEAALAVEATAPSVTELTVEQAIALTGTQGDLELNHLRMLSPQVAELLARSSTVFELNGLVVLEFLKYL